ncbi:sodium/proline symporter PutP [Oxalobacter aliiformigenes]|uniref:sodium/proline symporter PutP n=1 Tax=Oxalobacter aliiformigenes TaxID=2946593 RepID=UPI0022AF648C|nr:sodium/proline symporter PutP [Oxalobacter aliiformigenes]MCZ4065751.1 sodium/proline symporter PutP [Oxalobacter aliiformigenes]WAV98617.1 sodium/proline symporter PutP [Oxalobacter aliiformigenes]
MNVDTPLLVTFIVYIVATTLIGFIAYRATRNLSDYILGGRRLGSFVTAMSAGASDMSGWLLMGLPGAVFLSGLSEIWIAIGLIIGAWLNWFLVAGRLRVHTEFCGNAQTLPDYLTNRFEDKSKILRILSALVILIFFTIYCSSGMVAGARLFESTFGLSYDTALWIGAFATITYVFIGGFLAVSWTDTVQATLMIFALLITPVFAILAVGDLPSALSIIQNGAPGKLDMFKGLDFIAIISLLGWGLGYFGQPHILVRFMAADSVRSIPRARRISMTWMILCLAGAVATGFFGISYFSSNPSLATGVMQNNEAVFMELTKILFNPWIAGIVLSAIMAAVMSTLSCQLLVCSSALTEDFYRAFLRPKASQTELVWIGRMMVMLISIIAIAIAFNPDNKVLSLVAYAWAGFGAAFGPVILLSLIWKRMTRNGAFAGIFVGAATIILWKTCLDHLGIYEIIPGFLFGTIAIIITSLLGKPPSDTMKAQFEKADRTYHSEV